MFFGRKVLWPEPQSKASRSLLLTKKEMRLSNKFWLLGGLAACLAQGALAQCPSGSAAASHAATDTTPGSASAPEAGAPGDQRTVVLTLAISKSGVVHDATVLSGPASLRTAAVEAVKRRKFKQDAVNKSPGARQMTVAVTFAPGKTSAPEIQEAISAGVPGCVYATTIRVSQYFMERRLLHRVDPVYPPGATPLGIDGTVFLRVRIDKDGNVFKAEKIRGPDVLETAAIEAVKQWKYQPFLLNGDPIEVETQVEIYFTPPVLPSAQPTERSAPPTRDPNTLGYVTANELPDSIVPPANSDGNFILGPTPSYGSRGDRPGGRAEGGRD